MKKVWFLVGLGMGFVLGSKAGSGPYEHAEAKVRSVISRPDTQDAADDLQDAVQDWVDAVPNRAGDEVPAPLGTTRTT
jgi:hypothetical protein